MTPDVSVIIPVYNGEAFIEGTLRSILGQEGVGVQVVVSDDGSTDRTWSLVEGLRDDRVTLVRNRGKGVPAGLNTCLQFVAAPVVCRSDHDDYYTPGRLARQLEILRARPEMGAVCGAVEALTHDGEVVADLGSGDAAEEITGELRSGKLRTHFNTWAMRTELVRSLKGFRDFGLSGEDNDMQLRAGDASRVWYDPRVCYQWRLHATSITHRQPTVERVWAERLSYVLQEQRRSRGGPDDMDLGRPLPPPPPDLTPAPPPRVRDQIADILIGSSWQMLARGRRLAALRQARRAVAYRADRASLRNLAAVLAKLG